MNILKINDITAYSLQDMLIESGIEENKTFPYSVDIPTLKEFCTNYGITLPSELDIDLIEDLWQNIYGRYYQEIFAVVDETEKEEKNRINNYYYCSKLSILISKMKRTLPYYKTILSLYTQQEASLMEDITTTSKTTTGYNDTPQNVNTSGLYEGDNYLSNFARTNNETKTPLGTPMARLKEIQDSYSRLMERWIYEFDNMFVEVSNYE